MVKAQSSLEYMLLLSLAGVLSVSALFSANSQLSMQSGFQNETLARFANASGFNYPHNGSFVGGANASGQLELRLFASQPLYVGEPSLVQAVVYNYGARTVIPVIRVMSPNASIDLSPRERVNASAVFSSVLSSYAMARNPGIYVLEAAVLDDNGTVVKTGGGEPLTARIQVSALQGRNQGEQGPGYSVVLSRSGEISSYALLPGTEEVYSITVWTAGQDDGGSCSGCMPNPSALWRFSKTDSSGTVRQMCACLYKSVGARAAQVSLRPVPSFVLKLNVTNATGQVVSFALSQGELESDSPDGTASMRGLPIPQGMGPALQSVATTPPGAYSWSLRPESAFSEYKAARFNFESRLAGASGQCEYDCNGALAAANLLNSAEQRFLSLVTESGCDANASHFNCPAVFSFPPIRLSLSREFLGREIPCQQPEAQVVAGLDIEVDSCG